MRIKLVPKAQGFTLIELLVVIAIIGLLASVVLVALNNARLKGRMAKRLEDMKSVQTALELYYSDNNGYPTSSGAWRSQCSTYGSYAAANVVPGLVPTYMASFPSDPAMSITGNTSCYLYMSDGANYKMLDHVISDLSQPEYSNYPAFRDPSRDGGTDGCVVDGNASWALAVYSTGARCW